MALIITIAQQKGGAGKTMLAANLAAAWAGKHRVTLLDIDPQNSLGRWHALRELRPGLAAIGFAAVSGWRVKSELDRQARGRRHIGGRYPAADRQRRGACDQGGGTRGDPRAAGDA